MINETERPTEAITSCSSRELQAKKFGPVIDSEIILFLSFFILQYGVNQSTLEFILSYTMIIGEIAQACSAAEGFMRWYHEVDNLCHQHQYRGNSEN